MQQSKFQWLVLGLGLMQFIVLIAIVHHLKNPPAPAAPPTPVAALPGAEEPGLPDGDRESLLLWRIEALVKDVVRSELERGHPDTAPGAAPGHAAGDPTPAQEIVSEEQRLMQENAAATGRAIISQAIESGVWSEQHTHQLNSQIPHLSEEQRIELLELFHGALNRQQLEIEPQDMPVL